MAIIRMTRTRALFTTALALGVASSIGPLVAQSAAPATSTAAEPIRVVNVAQRGAPPTGPSAVVIEHDQASGHAHDLPPGHSRDTRSMGCSSGVRAAAPRTGCSSPSSSTRSPRMASSSSPTALPSRAGARGGPAAGARAGGARRRVRGGPPAGGRRLPGRRRGRRSAGGGAGTWRRGDDRRLGPDRGHRLDREGRQRPRRAASIRRSRPAAWRRWGCRAAG